MIKFAIGLAALLLTLGCARNPYAPYGYQQPWQRQAPGQQTLPPIPNSALQPPAGANVPAPGLGPGTIEQQRARASRFDPYADNFAAPPIEGGRPREFSRPRSEPTRSGDLRWPL